MRGGAGRAVAAEAPARTPAGASRVGAGGSEWNGAASAEDGPSKSDNPFLHASASEAVAPPTWDTTAYKHHAEHQGHDASTALPPQPAQGGAGACWAATSAGLVFVAHDDKAYQPDASVYRHTDIRQVVRVAPVKVPRF